MTPAESLIFRLLEKTDPPLQILLVDDAEHDLIAQQRTLESCKLLNDIRQFKSGAAALEFLRNSNEGRPARFLIFLDLIMPPDHGTVFLRKMQEEGLAPGSIVVMLSGLSDVRLLHEGYQLGAQTFLVKPLKVQDVMELLTSLRQSIAVLNEVKGNRLVWIPATRGVRADFGPQS